MSEVLELKVVYDLPTSEFFGDWNLYWSSPTIDEYITTFMTWKEVVDYLKSINDPCHLRIFKGNMEVK